MMYISRHPVRNNEFDIYGSAMIKIGDILRKPEGDGWLYTANLYKPARTETAHKFKDVARLILDGSSYTYLG